MTGETDAQAELLAEVRMLRAEIRHLKLIALQDTDEGRCRRATSRRHFGCPAMRDVTNPAPVNCRTCPFAQKYSAAPITLDA